MADKNFKSKAAYLKWIKYGHASGEFKETPGNQSVSIRNKNKKVEHTKYLDGGQLQIPPPNGEEATYQDSLDVYNNAVQQQNYYNSLKEYYDKPTWKKTNIKSDVIKNITKEHLKHGNVSKTEKEKIKKGISSNIYYIKDMIPTAIDPNAPLAIYNPKIKPQGVIDYSPKGGLEINKIYKKYWNKISNDVDYIEGRKSDSEILSKYLSDNEYKKFKELEQINLTAQSNLQGIYTQLPYYSPLANKPAKLLTDKEVIKRFNQFGPSGISKERLKSLGLISKNNNTTTTSTSRTNTSKTSTPKIVKKEEPVLPEVVLDPSMFPEQQPIFDYVEPVATPAGKTNKIISYSAEPLMIKDATTGRLIKNPNRNPIAIDTQGNKIEQKAYGGQLQPPPDEPTFQDSLDVYNNSMKVQKYYNALPSEKTVNYLNAYKAQKKYSDSFLKDVTNKNKNVTKKISNDPDKYFFKDEIYGAIDENAPDIEYNTKIAPQGTLTYAPKGSNELYKAQKELRAKYKGLDTYDDESLRKNLTPTELKKFTKLVTTQANSSTQMPGQKVSVPYYSPLAIKPAKLLTDEEIIERVKKYGPTGIDPKKIESLGINIKALNKTTKPTTTKKVIPTTKPVEQVIIPTTVQKDSINTAVEQVITPTGKTNKVPGGIISYTSQPRFTKDKYGRVIPNTNTQTKENFVGYKQEKAYGGYINKIDAPEIGGYFRLKNQMADGGELSSMSIPEVNIDYSAFPKQQPIFDYEGANTTSTPQVQVPTYQGKPAPIYSGNFNQAFGEARKNGDEVFTWNNKVYGTKLASSTKKESAPVVNTNNTVTVKPKVQKKEEPLQVAGKAGQYILDSINNISNPDTDTVISGIQAITNKIDTLAKKQKAIENIAKVAIKSNSNTSIKTKTKNTLIESRPIVDVKSPFLDENTEKTIMQRQNKDFVYSKFMNKGAEIRSRTDVGRLKESQKFLEDLVPELQFKGAKSLIIDIGSGLENPDENLRGVTVSELMSSKKIATSADIIATDIEPAYNKYKAGKKQMVDAYSLPVTFETPIKNVIRKREKDVKNKYNTIILRSANGIDLIMDEKDTYKHFDKVSKDTKEYPVYYMYNKHILYKPANTTTFSIIGELGEKGFDHRTSSWKIEDDSAPYNMRIGNTMNSVTPNQSPIKPAGMAYGGYINTPEIGGQFVRKMAKGGDLITKLSPKEETDFQNFYKTLPDNLKQDDNTYDLRGYWNSENRPSTFDYSQPVQSDGYYHAYSRNRYTDKILKAPTHETFRMAIEEDKKGGLAPLIGVDGNVYTKGEFISPIEDETGAPLNTNMLIDSRAYGGYINEMAKGGDIKYGSKEYNKAYREGTIARQVGDEYIMNLPDAEAMAEKYAVTAIDPRSIDPMSGERYPMWNQLSESGKRLINDPSVLGIGQRNKARGVTTNELLQDVGNQLISSGAEATGIPGAYRLATGEGDWTDALGVLPGLATAYKTVGNIQKLRNLKKAVNTPTSLKPIETPSVGNIINQAESVTPKPWQLQELPGLHLQSTMSDGAISKIVQPKTGLINTEQALAIIGKESGGADKVALIKQGLGENIPKKMDFNEFRRITQEQLIPLERQFATHSSEYGIHRLGYGKYKTVINERGNPVLQPLKGKNLEPLENQTLILSNKSKFGRGSSAHGNPDETLGHIHFLRDAKTPDVLTVTQIQSDAFQGTHRVMPKTQQEALNKVNKLKEEGKEIKNIFNDGNESSKSVLNNYEKHLQLDEATAKNFTQKQLLDKTHQERYLQELVNYAGERGDVSKLRLPTSETAAKVQGYKQKNYDNVFKELEDLKDGKISDVSKLSSDTKSVITGQGNTSLVDITGATPVPRNYKEVLSDLNKNKDFLRFLENKKGIKGYDPEHQTILKKYSEQPKTIKKLFGVEPKIVTDSKGNTWYEFDIPERFKGMKGEIKAFGLGGFIGAGAATQQKAFGGYIDAPELNGYFKLKE